ncbi:MAG: hypothetical protein ACM3L8_04495 [Verrucomicrobiota bacterium]
MTLRLFPWAAVALIVLGLAVASLRPGKSAPPAPVLPPAGEGGPEIRLGTVTVREFHDDGQWNLLTADNAVYSYARKTVRASGVAVSLGKGKVLEGAFIRAPEALWDFDHRTVFLPDGGHADRKGGWTGELSASTMDLAGRVLRVPGPATVAGPGFVVAGMNLAWYWWEGKISMDSPNSRIAPALIPRREPVAR